MSEAPAISRASSQAPLSFPSDLPTNGPPDVACPGFLDVHQIMRELPSGLLVVAAPSGRPLFYNNQAARLLCLPAWPETDESEINRSEITAPQTDAVERALRGMLRPDAQPYPEDEHPLTRAAQRGDTIHQEEIWLPAPGSARLCLALNATPILNAQGEIVATACTFDDITARKASEIEMERQNEHLQNTMESLQVAQEDLLLMRSVVEAEKQRYQELFEAATDGYITTDLNGIIDEANHAAILRLGLSPSYVIGRILTNYVALEDRNSFRSFLSRLGQGIETKEWEGRFTPRGNVPFDAVLTVSGVQGMEVESVSLRWILRDITQRKQMEQARAADQERLLEQERRAGVLEERNRIAQEFHDTLAQGFTGISFLLAAAEGAVMDAPEQARAQIARARKVATECITEARRSIHALRSLTLANGSLPVALAHVVEQARTQSNAEIDFQVQGVPLFLPVQVENDLLRIGQEAVTNALKHAKAAHISVHLAFARDQVQINVIDDGKGLPEKAMNEKTMNAVTGYGLIGIRERTQRIGGQLTLGSAAGKGTRIRVVVTLPPQNAPV